MIGGPAASSILQQTIADRFERAFAVFGLMMMIGTLQIFFGESFADFGNPAKAGGAEGNLVYQVACMVIYGVSLFNIVQRTETLIWVVQRNKLFFLFLLYILASALWADAPGISIRRGTALVGTSMFALYLVMRFESNDLLRLLALAFLATGVLNVAATLAMPSVGFQNGDAMMGMRGLLGHKNTFGRTMILGALAFVFLARGASLKKPLYWAGFAFMTALVVLSMSRTAWFTTLVLLFVAIPFLDSLRRSRLSLGVRLALVVGVGLTSVIILVIDYWQTGLALFGRDATFTGRTFIWEYVIMAAWERPWLGYGYQSFWTGSGASFVYTFVTWGEFGHSHNAYLDLWASLGFVGCGLFLASLAVLIRRMFVRLTQTNDPMGMFYPCALALMLVLGLSAYMFPQHGSIFWVTYSATFFYLSPIGFKRPHAAEVIRRLRPRARPRLVTSA